MYLKVLTISDSRNRTSEHSSNRALGKTDFVHSDASAIARHPRNLASTVRRQDTTRKEARERRKARKEEELLKKKEEVKRLKALKMKEMKSKLERIGREGGWKDLEENEGR